MSNNRTKITICLLIVVALIIILTFALREKTGERFSDLTLNEQEFQSLISGRAETDSLFDGIIIEDQELFYDSTEDYYMYSLIKDDASAFDPSVKLKSSHSGLKIAFLEKEISKDLISQNGTIDFIVYDRTKYQRSHLKCSTLPVISINTSQEDLMTRDDIAMSLKLFDNSQDATDRFTVTDGLIHRRGNSSFAFPKGSYKLSLTRNSATNAHHSNSMSLLGMPSDDDWILTSMYGDKEKIRDVFSTNLWTASFGTDNKAGINLGTEFKYVEVFINGKYNGIYALGYKLRNDQLKISRNSNDRVLFYNEDQPPYTPYYVDRFGNVANFSVLSGQSSDCFSSFREYLMRVYFSQGNKEALYDLVDIDNIVDYFLFINFIQGMDNTTWNQNMLLDKNGDKYTLYYSPWDMDYTFGRSYYAETVSAEHYALSPEDMFLVNYGTIGSLIKCDEDAFSDKMREKYDQMRATLWSDEQIDALISEYESQIFSSGAFLRECSVWDNVDESDNVAGLSRFRSYVHDRLKAMDKFVKDPDYSLSDEDEELSFGMAEGYLASRLMFEDPEAIRLLEIKDSQILDYAYYQETMKSLGIPEDMIKTDGSVRDQLCYYGDDAYYWSVPEDTDLIAKNGEDAPICSSDFFKGESVIPLPQGDLSYHADGNGTETIYLGDEPLFSLESPTDDYCLRLIIINPETMTLEDVYQW